VKPRFILPLLIAASGCYHYVPVEGHAIPPATQVSVELTSMGSAAVQQSLGDRVEAVEGEVMQTEPNGGLTLALLSVHRRGEVKPSLWARETLRLGANDINSVSRREISRKRTFVASAALGATAIGLVVAIAKATGAFDGGSGGGKGPPPTP
jgi:hypothetical protein